MTLKDRLAADLKSAMKSGDKTRLGVIRMLRSRMQEAEVDRRAEKGPDYSIDDEAAVEAIASYAKQRRESIESYRQAGRENAAAQEEAELAIIREYLPEQLTEARIREIVREAVAQVGAGSPKDMGAVMKLVMPQVKGRADGRLVNEIVRQALTPRP
jgi:hypothetical protein